jgi:hypothetical protein
MEKKAISAPEKNADNPRQIKTAIKSINGLACSGRARGRGRPSVSHLVRKTAYEEERIQKM